MTGRKDARRALFRAMRRVAVGVSGHRSLAEIDKVRAGIDAALARIESSFGPTRLTIVSALAEGADRLVVERALLRRGVRLVVVLPLPPRDYVRDFKTVASRAQFQALLHRADEVLKAPRAPSRQAAYAAAGRAVLDRCDVLLAVWDGRAARGEGGTGQMVVEARARGLAIAWVHAGNRPPRAAGAASLGEDQGTTTFENFS